MCELCEGTGFTCSLLKKRNVYICIVYIYGFFFNVFFPFSTAAAKDSQSHQRFETDEGSVVQS